MTPTPQQQDVIQNRSGLFTVRACPGSGKTVTVAARLRHLFRNWQHKNQGIAVASFTNIAWMEIHDYLAKEFNTPFPGYPHFLGTLDSFINTYIFLPFGHLVMKSGRRPELWGAPHNDKEPGFWKTRLCNQNQCKLNDFTYDRAYSPRSSFNPSSRSTLLTSSTFCCERPVCGLHFTLTFRLRSAPTPSFVKNLV